MNQEIAVVGAGSWGTALASAWATKGHRVTVIGRDPQLMDTIQSIRQNDRYLPNIMLPETLAASADLAALNRADIIAFVTPAQTFSDTLKAARPHLRSGQFCILCSKGIDKKTGKPLFDIASELQPELHHCVLSGPSFARDVARGLPTAVTLASRHRDNADLMAVVLSTDRLRIYSSTDVIGVETGGALKNVLALAVGMAHGLGLGASAEAALISRGFAELSRLAIALGARPETLIGLSGLGDLVLTCSSSQSRNFSYGMALGAGEDCRNLALAEGVFTASVAWQLAVQHGIDAPIIEAVCQILDGHLTPSQAVEHLLSRPLKSEDVGE